jgi:hypothetical protein
VLPAKGCSNADKMRISTAVRDLPIMRESGCPKPIVRVIASLALSGSCTAFVAAFEAAGPQSWNGLFVGIPFAFCWANRRKQRGHAAARLQDDDPTQE